jgi:hypothetical protein
VVRLIRYTALPFNLPCILRTSLTLKGGKREKTWEIKNWICFAWEQEEGEINGATKHSGERLPVHGSEGPVSNVPISLLSRARSLHYKTPRWNPSGKVHPVKLALHETDG